MRKIYLGTELKVQLNITADGFNMLTNDYSVDIKKQNTDRIVMHLDKDDIVVNDGQCYMLLDSQKLGTGTFQAVVTAYIPDSDFADGDRKEVTCVDLFTIQRA